MGESSIRRDAKCTQRLVSNNWKMVQSSIFSIDRRSEIRPSDSSDIFIITPNADTNEIKIKVKPIVFKVRERALKNSTLYICVEGRLDFDSPILNQQRPSAKSFGTSVGYFRHHTDYLDHVYGVHYDFDKSIFGHPVFHAQMKPMMDFKENIQEQFNDKRNIIDKVSPILRNVRMPSAEMDIFSVFSQIIADHLINSKSEKEVRTKFVKTLSSCDFFAGVAQTLTNFNQASATSRYRSPCWYPGFNP